MSEKQPPRPEHLSEQTRESPGAGGRADPRGSGNAPDERFARGLELAAKFFPPGAPGSPRFAYPREIEEDWNRFSISTVLGDVWARPGLDLKQRAMITIAALTALNKPEQLRAYIVAGLNLGLVRTEVCEVILQMAVYGGFPAAIQGLAVAKDVFDEFDRSSRP